MFLRIGNLTFGGGDPTMTALQRELTERRRWLDPEQCGLAWSLARVTPGTNVLAFCAAIGWMLRRHPGAIAAVTAACLPAALFSVWLIAAWQSWSSHPWVRAAFGAIAASVVGMMLAGAALLVRPQFKPGRYLRSLCFLVGALLLVGLLSVSPFVVLLIAGAVGWLWKENDE